MEWTMFANQLPFLTYGMARDRTHLNGENKRVEANIVYSFASYWK